MTDHELRDLLHERVADVGMPDLSEVAWQRATRIRRRRAVMTVTAAVAVVAVGSVAVTGGPGGHRSTDPVTQLPSPTTTSVPSPPPPTRTGTQPDGHYRGWPVYWGPPASQESTLPQVASPLPSVIDLSAPTTDVATDPIDAALAAYALTDDNGGLRLLLLAADGSLRTVDTSRVAPFDDGAGNDVSVARETLLSPTGKYLAFPQPGSVLVLTLASGAWRTVDTGDAPTDLDDLDGRHRPVAAVGARRWPRADVLRDRRTALGQPETAPAGGSARAGSYAVRSLAVGPNGDAQSWSGWRATRPRGGDHPVAGPRREGDAPTHDALLVLGSAAMAQDDVRPDPCCGVAFWLDAGDGRLRVEGSPGAWSGGGSAPTISAA